jgi:hypothetical protein
MLTSLYLRVLCNITVVYHAAAAAMFIGVHLVSLVVLMVLIHLHGRSAVLDLQCPTSWI